MPIPDYQSIMLPLLEFAGDKKEHSIREAIEHIANIFNLSEEERREVLLSGQQYIIDNRVGWARTYLKKAGLLESTKRSYFKITDLGLEVLQKNPKKINVKFLEQSPNIANVDFGHTDPKITFPIGGEANLIVEERKVKLELTKH